MRTRFISGAILTIIFLACLFIGRYGMFIFSLAASGIGMYELYHVVGIHKSKLGITGYVFCGIYYVLTWFGLDKYMFAYMVISALAIMFVYVLVYSHRSAEQAGFALLGIYYVAIPFSFLFRIRTIEVGDPSYIPVCLTLLLVNCTWISDVFAYFVGSAFGKHKLAPVISPKKSVEGAVGGIVMSTFLGFSVGFVIGAFVNKPYLFIILGCMSIAGSILSIFGDLSASAIKRHYNIKDYGKVIPGHGGILDRFDSMIFVAPLIYFGAYFLLPYFAR